MRVSAGTVFIITCIVFVNRNNLMSVTDEKIRERERTCFLRNSLRLSIFLSFLGLFSWKGFENNRIPGEVGVGSG